MRPRWENDCQVVLPCRGIWENKALHKTFLFFFSAKQKLAGRCWLFLWFLDLFSAAVIIRRIKMELSASRVCWLAWFCTGQRTSYSWEGMRRNNRLYLTKNPHVWKLTVTYICTNDSPVESSCRYHSLSDNLLCLSGCTQTLLFNGVDFCFLLFVIHKGWLFWLFWG